MTSGKTNVVKKRVKSLKKKKLMSWAEFKRRVRAYRILKLK